MTELQNKQQVISSVIKMNAEALELLQRYPDDRLNDLIETFNDLDNTCQKLLSDMETEIEDLQASCSHDFFISDVSIYDYADEYTCRKCGLVK